MKGIRSLFLLGLVGALPLAAQDFDLKVRAGLTAGSVTDQVHDNKLLGLGVGMTLPLGKGHNLVAELAFDYLPGRGADVLPASGTPVYFNNKGTIVNQINGAPLTLQVANGNGSAMSVLRRTQGFSLRGGYLADLPWFHNVSWQAGLTLDNHKTQSQSTGGIVPVYTDPADQRVKSPGYESWAMVEEQTKLRVGAYAGVVHQIHENHKLEVNLRNFGYGVREYTPLALSGKAAGSRDVTGRAFVLEVALTVKL